MHNSQSYVFIAVDAAFESQQADLSIFLAGVHSSRDDSDDGLRTSDVVGLSLSLACPQARLPNAGTDTCRLSNLPFPGE